jgi:hypothetical protein
VYYFCFFCFDPAFPVLGRLLQKAPRELKTGLLYTMGLASILLVTRQLSLVDQMEQLAGTPPKAREIWTVDRSELKSVSCTCSPLIEMEADAIKVLPYDRLPLVSKTTVDEYIANMATLIPKIQVHIPDEIGTFVHLTTLVNELVAEMLYSFDPVGPVPDTLSEYSRQQFTSGSSLPTKILHQNTDRLVQINAALSYVSTQALSGAVPILERRSLIRRHSLLGVGTAVLALTRIAHSIETAFAQGAVEHILVDHAPQARPLPGLDSLPDYDPSNWAEYALTSLRADTDIRQSYPKLPYFSGRLGFRETEYTISAALQSLAAGASPSWSILTVTHEMVHGHVRNLLSLIFQGDANRRPDRKWGDFYDRFAMRCNGTLPPNESLLDSLRAVILAYCCNVVEHGSLTWNPAVRDDSTDEREFDFILLESEPLWLAYEAEYRNISEIFVHVLDLHYFYMSAVSQYIPLIWRSWSTAPQVRGDLRQYLLRSLLVVASKTPGTIYQRFRGARSRLAELLNGAAEQGAEKASVIVEAGKRLGREEYVEKQLFYPFAASIILVDLVHHVLTSSAIRGAINADPHFRSIQTTTFEDWLEYDMRDGFVDDNVISPTAYIAHRLSRTLAQGEPRDTEADTAALFLACSSRPAGGVYHG